MNDQLGKLNPPSTPVLQILNGAYKGKQFRLLSSQITIGRHNDCDVIFKDDLKCSKQHARIKKEEAFYIIESLNPKNPVLVNNKAISSQILRSKDKVTIGNVELLFLEKSAVTFPIQKAQTLAKQTNKKKWLNPPRLILLAFVGVALYLAYQTDSKTEQSALNLKTEEKVLEDIKALKKLNQEEAEKKELSPQEDAARTAFIKGFRDYRKGYFNRSLKMFQHCLTLHKTNKLCLSYSRKSKVQIDKLIQKKIRLGNAYKRNKQYKACRAAFQSVEIMIQDSQSTVYKEARENRKLCEIQLKNKI